MTQSELIEALFEFAYGDAEESFALSIEEIETALAEEGIDMKKAIAELRKRIRDSLSRIAPVENTKP